MPIILFESYVELKPYIMTNEAAVWKRISFIFCLHAVIKELTKTIELYVQEIAQWPENKRINQVKSILNGHFSQNNVIFNGPLQVFQNTSM